MTLAYAIKLDLTIQPTNIKAQKIDNSIFMIFGMVLTGFWVDNKLDRSYFFQKTFLPRNIGMEMVFDILFSILSNANILFIEHKFT